MLCLIVGNKVPACNLVDLHLRVSDHLAAWREVATGRLLPIPC